MIANICFVCSIHALKDEAFLRATLQKQAARLHHASVTYDVSSNNVASVEIATACNHEKLMSRS